MTTNLIALELRLLVLKHGMLSVVRALAGLRNITPEELERELSDAERQKSSRKTTKHFDRSALVERFHLEPERREKVMLLVERYDAGLFLTRAKDVTEFIRRFKGTDCPIRNRKNACSAVVEVLAVLNANELNHLIESSTEDSQANDLAMVAEGIMGRHRIH